MILVLWSCVLKKPTHAMTACVPGVKAAYREAVSAGGSQVVLHVAAALGKAIVAAMALVTPEQLQAAVQGTDDCGVDPRAGARALVSPKAVVLAKLLQACKVRAGYAGWGGRLGREGLC